jgi:predicted ArsR family transcriptional regulator
MSADADAMLAAMSAGIPLMSAPKWYSTAIIAGRLNVSEASAREHLQELANQGLVVCSSQQARRANGDAVLFWKALA